MNDMSVFGSGIFFSARELAEAARERGLTSFPNGERGARYFAERAGWNDLPENLSRWRPQGDGGRPCREYHFTLLPPYLRAVIDSRDIRRDLAARHDAASEADQRKIEALKMSSLSPRAKAVLEARAEVLRSIEGFAISKGKSRAWGVKTFLAAQDAISDRQEIEARRDAGQILTDREAASLAKPLILTADEGFMLQPETLVTANDRKTKAKISRTTVYDWFKARDENGVGALAPKATRTPEPIHPGFKGFLKYYAVGSKPDAVDALAQYLKEENPPADLRMTISQVRYALRQKLSNIERNVGREGLLTLRSRLAYVTRTTDDMLPTTVYSADGKTFDAEIADPVTHRPIRPEITTVVDVATRKVVGISLDRSENQRSVAEALRRSCVSNGICAIFYVDRGPGYRNQALDADISGLMGRLGITKAHAAPYGSQAKGLIERINGTVWNTLAKRLPTYIGRDMDKQAGDRIHKATRSELKEFGQSQQLPSWQEFVQACDAMVESYNDKPHSSLPKFQDPETGKWRHMSPNEAWAMHEAAGFEAVTVAPEEADDLFRPYVIRQVRRCEVSWNDNRYFDDALNSYHETKVMVGYDYHQADRVWIREFDVETGQPGKLICVARFMANAQRYFPKSFEDAALEKRTTSALKRIDVKRQGVEAERDGGMLIEHQHSANVVDLFQEPRGETIDVTPTPAIEERPHEAASAARPIAPRRKTFASDEELAAWALENPDELSRNQIEVLRDCMNSSTARELFRLSGIDTEALRTLLRAVA